MTLQIQDFYNHHDQNSGDNTDNACSDCVKSITSGCHCNQTCQGSIEAHGNIRFSVFYPGINQSGQGRYGRGNCRRQENRRQFRRRCRCCSVESVPSQPENKHAQRSKRNRMTGNRVDFDNFAVFIRHILPDPGAENDSTNQCRNPAHHMNGTGSCVIMKPSLGQPAAAPDPMGLNGIDQQADHA